MSRAPEGQAVDRRRLERLRQRLASLSAISRGVARPDRLDDLCRTIQREVNPVLQSSVFFLGLYHEASESLEVVSQFESGVEYPGGVVPLGQGLIGQVIRTRQSRLIRHWSVEGPRVQLQYSTGKPGLPESAIAVPLLVGEQVIGVLSAQSDEPEAFDEDDVLLLEAVGGLAAAGIETFRHSERLDAQQLQRISELEAILTNMAEGLLIVDDVGRVIRLNHAARQLLTVAAGSVVIGELSRADWEGWPLGSDPVVRAVAEALHTLVSALQKGESLHDLVVELGSDARVLSFTGAPIRDAAGALRGGVIVFRDVTEAREVQRLKDEMLREVEERSQQLEVASRHKSEFLANMSHELRTPLNAILGYTELLTDGIYGDVPEVMLGVLARIGASGTHLLGLINAVLDLSKIEAGQLALQADEYSLSDVIVAVTSQVEPLVSEKGLALRIDVAEDLPPGYGDERRLNQVLLNLVGNAIKFTDAGEVTVRAVMIDGRFVVSVADTGPGIREADRESIFEQFQQGDASITRQKGGTGLGLAIARRIAEMHGGRIWVESELGRGSTFTFEVPVRVGAPM